MMKSEFYTVAEFSEIVRIPIRTAYYLVEQGAIEHLKFGSRIRIPARVLGEYVASPRQDRADLVTA